MKFFPEQTQNIAPKQSTEIIPKDSSPKKRLGHKLRGSVLAVVGASGVFGAGRGTVKHEDGEYQYQKDVRSTSKEINEIRYALREMTGMKSEADIFIDKATEYGEANAAKLLDDPEGPFATSVFETVESVYKHSFNLIKKIGDLDAKKEVARSLASLYFAMTENKLQDPQSVAALKVWIDTEQELIIEQRRLSVELKKTKELVGTVDRFNTMVKDIPNGAQEKIKK